jgi:hypothetical protein
LNKFQRSKSRTEASPTRCVGRTLSSSHNKCGNASSSSTIGRLIATVWRGALFPAISDWMSRHWVRSMNGGGKKTFARRWERFCSTLGDARSRTRRTPLDHVRPRHRVHGLALSAGGGLGVQTWFCDPQAPWQKGTVENTNRRARRWLTRDTDPLSIEDRHLKDVCAHLNSTPRKCLGFRTPSEVFRQKLMASSR